MKGYILDTDTWIEYFHRRNGVEKHIAATPADQIYVSEQHSQKVSAFH